MQRITGLFAAPVLIAGIMGSTEAAATDAATAATNPVGGVNQLQLQNLYADRWYNSEGTANTFIIQPILSFDLPDGGYFDSWLTRITIPYVSTPTINGVDDTDRGDTTALIIPTHTDQGEKEGEFTTWGPIAALGIPTSLGDLTGPGVWSAGPGVVWVSNKTFENGNSLMFGTLAWHLWDVEDDTPVSNTSVIPVGIYKFKSLFDQDGWYARLPDDAWKYNWETDEFTTIPWLAHSVAPSQSASTRSMHISAHGTMPRIPTTRHRRNG